jgi:hypothetical protein
MSANGNGSTVHNVESLNQSQKLEAFKRRCLQNILLNMFPKPQELTSGDRSGGIGYLVQPGNIVSRQMVILVLIM